MVGQGYHAYVDPWGFYRGIAKFGPNKFIYTPNYYKTPNAALKQLAFEPNTYGKVLPATSAQINRIISELMLKKTYNGNISNKLFNHITAASGLHRFSRGR